MTRWLPTLAFFGATLVLVPAFAEAALGDAQEPFTISADPAAPTANSSVTITPVSGSVDVTTATMTVSVNGAQTYSGGAVPFTLRMSAPGKTENIIVSIKARGATYRQTLSLTPEDVVIVAEPLSSAPPLYLGKALPPLGGSVRMVAIADLRTTTGKQLDPATLSYHWTVDGSEAQSGSGIGKRTLIVDSPLEYRSSTVVVTVTSPDGALSGSTSFDFTASEPATRIYERDPLMGVRFDKALGDSFAIVGSEVSLYAAPFSFPTSLGAPTLSWYVAGALAQTGPLITLRPTGKGAGITSVSATAASKGSVDAPAASAALSVSFGASGSSNLFGL